MALKSNRLRVGVAFLLAVRDQRRVKKAFSQNATTEQKAWVLTGAYLGLIVIAFGLFHSTGNKLGGVVDGEKLNSLGDFLSGIFAPLAFFWLVVSVKTQSKELAAQREELTMTRQEFVDNREVMEKQAEAAEAHKNFVEQQTWIMGQQANLAEDAQKKNYKLMLFEKRMEIYTELQRIVASDDHTLARLDLRHLSHLQNRAKFLFGTDIDLWLEEVFGYIEKYQSAVTEAEREDVREFFDFNTLPDDFETYFRHYLEVTDGHILR